MSVDSRSIGAQGFSPARPTSSPEGLRYDRPRNVRRVLMTADAVGGVWTYALDLSRELVSRGISVDLAVLGPRPSDAQRTDAVRAGVTLLEHPGRLEWMDDPWTDVDAAGEWLIDLDRGLHPDVVHLNGFSHAALPWTAPVLVVAHSCVCSWWRAVKGEEAPEAFDEYRARVSKGIRAAALVIAPTAAMLSELESDYGRPAVGRVIPNGRAFVPATGIAEEPIVFAAGRLWDEAKNIGTLCATARELTWPVCVAGSAQHATSTCAVPPHVRHVGCLDAESMRAWFARASIYALPARYEPFGLSVLEAALSGCALVLGDIPSLREIWNDAARFVAPDDERAVAAAIQELIDDQRLRERWAVRALARTMRFTVGRMADDYLSAYSGMVMAA
jgi:glycogen(starch) synthase